MKKINTKNEIYAIGCTTLSIYKYVALALGVFYLGSFIAAGLIFVVKGSSIENVLLAKIYDMVTYYGINDATNTIRLIGKTNAKIAVLVYAFAYSLHYGLIYVMLYRFKEIFKTIVNDKVFTSKNISVLYETIKIALIASFAQPLIMGANIILTHAFLNFSSFDFSGIMFLFVAVLLYMVLVSGYNIDKKRNEYDLELEDYRAQISDLEIEKLKLKTQEKEEKEETKESTTKRRRRRRKKPAAGSSK
jgi:hypothetical protein